MKKKTASHDNVPEEQFHHIPDLEIIDLDAETAAQFTDTASSQEDFHEDAPSGSRTGALTEPSGKRAGILRYINIHTLLLIVILLFIAGIFYKFMTWGVRVDPSEIIPGTYDNSNDQFLPLMDADGQKVRTDYSGNITILAFGNAPFADDRGSEDNLANMIASMTGATVYNCSVSGSYLAADGYPEWESWPSNMFTFYWLCFLAEGHEGVAERFMEGMNELGGSAPPEAMEVYNTLMSIDLADVDVITLMYDGSDYLADHEMYNDADASDITQFTGNMVAGIEMLQEKYPHIRIIVLSPPYAYAIDENGNYISSDIQRYSWDVLSTYAIKQAQYAANLSVTFVDNLYGTITEDNASEYLIDNIHLNVEGRKLVARRFVNALYHFNDL